MRYLKAALVCWLFALVAVALMGCALMSGKLSTGTTAERMAAVIADAKQTAAAIRWAAPIAAVVVADSCHECVAGYKAASATYQALSLLVDKAAYDAEQNPGSEEAQQNLIDLTKQAKQAWEDIDAAYKGDPEPITEAGEEIINAEEAGDHESEQPEGESLQSFFDGSTYRLVFLHADQRCVDVDGLPDCSLSRF